MNAPTRRAFLGLAQNAVVAAAIGAVGVHLVGVAEAMPIDSDLAKAREPTDFVRRAQWWGPPPPPPPRPGWGHPHRRRRRRWVCWWHRGRRVCGWR